MNDVNITDWNLNSLSLTSFVPDGTGGQAFTLTASATTTELSTGNQATNITSIDLYVIDSDSINFTSMATNGDDTIIGSDSDDLLDGGEGHDTIQAGSGNDTIVFDPEDTLTNGGEGHDTLLISHDVLDFSSVSDGTVQNIEALDLNSDTSQSISLTLDDVLDMTGSENTLELTGGEGDTISIETQGWNEVSPGSGLFTNGVNQVQIVAPPELDNDIDIIYTDDGTPIG